MMQVRCQRCGWVFTMSRDAIGLAVAEAEAGQSDYYQADCPKCRHVVKVQVKELRRRLPPDYVLPALPPKPEPIHVKKDEPQPAAVPAQAEAPAAEAKPPKPAKPKTEPAAKPKAATKTKTAAQSKAAPKAKSAPKRSTPKSK